MTDRAPFRLFADAPSVQNWLDHLAHQGVPETGRQKIAQSTVAIKEQAHKESPLYLRALSGIGAVISGALVLYLLYLFGLFDLTPASLSANGLILMGLATILHRVGLRNEGLKQDFLIQMALTLLQAGKVALVAGLAQWAHEVFDFDWAWPIAVILGLVAIISFLLFPSSLERFVAAFSFLAAIWACLLVDSPDVWQGPLFTLVLALHLLALAVCLASYRLRMLVTSLYDALLLSLCLGVGIIATFIKLTDSGELEAPIESLSIGLAGFAHKWPSQIVLLLALAAIILWVAGRQRVRFGEPLVACFLAIALLGLISDPGILLALGLIILGYATHKPAHSVLGVLFAIGFGFHFYYAMDLTLLQKSGVLVASGLLFVGAAGYIRWRGWHVPKEGDTSDV